MGMLASLLFAQKREASAAPPRTYHSNRENSVSSSSHIPSSTGKLVAMYSHNRKTEPRPKKFTGVVFREKGYSPNIENFEIFLKYEQIKPLKG